jgi:alcohol dehydrogenase class IV
MSIGSLYAGISLANAGVGAVHALAYPLGGQFNVPHGIANGILLPHIMEFNVPGDIAKFAEVAGLLGERVECLSPAEAAYRSVEAVKNLLRDVDMPTTLTELNIPRSAIPEMAAASINVTRLMGNNPRRMTAKDSEKVYEKAF